MCLKVRVMHGLKKKNNRTTVTGSGNHFFDGSRNTSQAATTCAHRITLIASIASNSQRSSSLRPRERSDCWNELLILLMGSRCH